MTCLTRPVKRPNDGVVAFRSVNGDVYTEDGSFFYLEASISKVDPLIVLRTGGTNVTISGTGAEIAATFLSTLEWIQYKGKVNSLFRKVFDNCVIHV